MQYKQPTVYRIAEVVYPRSSLQIPQHTHLPQSDKAPRSVTVHSCGESSGLAGRPVSGIHCGRMEASRPPWEGHSRSETHFLIDLKGCLILERNCN